MTLGVPQVAVESVRRYGRVASVYQTLTPRFSHWVSGESLVAYVQAHRWPGSPPVWVAAGEPIGPLADCARAARAFEAAAARSDASALWFGVEEPGQLGGGHTALVIGAQPVWRVAPWPEKLASKASLRAQRNRASNKGVQVEEWEENRVAESPALRQIQAAWIARRGMPALSFLADPHVLDVLIDRRVFVASRAGAPVAYLVLAPIPVRDGWHAEWLVRSPAAPNGTAALLLNAAVRAVEGSQMVTLGLVPLSTYAPLSDPASPFAVRALLAWTRAHARRFYNFEGLERFKAKFLPDRWDPVYLLMRGSVRLDTLYAVADAFSGERGPVGLVGRAFLNAVADEARMAAQHLQERVG